MTVQEFLTWIKELIEASAPALAVLLWNYDQSQIDEAKNKTLDAQTNLELEKNNEQVQTKYIGRNDIDVLRDAISNGGGGNGQLGSSDETNRQDTTSSSDPKK